MLPCVTVQRHADDAATVGVPFMVSRRLPASWDDALLALAQLVQDELWGACDISMGLHKAEQIFLGGHAFYSQSCRSWRPECQLRYLRCDGQEGGLTSYWGMGLTGQHREITGMVARTRSTPVLQAVLRVLGTDAVLWQPQDNDADAADAEAWTNCKSRVSMSFVFDPNGLAPSCPPNTCLSRRLATLTPTRTGECHVSLAPFLFFWVDAQMPVETWY